MSCCPKESWGPIKAGGPETDYVNKGVVDAVGEMQVYRVGESPKCIFWNYHIMGFNGGRARQLVDMIASKECRPFCLSSCWDEGPVSHRSCVTEPKLQWILNLTCAETLREGVHGGHARLLPRRLLRAHKTRV